jgi:hypothetical protein
MTTAETSANSGTPRSSAALDELFDVPLSSGTVAGITIRVAGRLGGFLEHARGQITAH